ncbi:hypothetical protein V5O48_006947 [Marasmius crinis-equi]|uniref:G-protein coupled receptors family 2 profile 2 domain-containing protein n=1 Tax=Marasmius crinis-equi TaxID=585013 RepID=A0ABR3FI18_9AGAR
MDDNQVYSPEILITSSVATGVTSFVLFLVAIAALHPRSRRLLDRVSFRLMVAALCANLGYAIGMMKTSVNPDGRGCSVQVWVISFTLHLSSYLLFCIGLNLQLVMIHGINGQNMEKYYVLGSVMLAGALSLAPLIAGQVGYDPIEQRCGWKSEDLAERLRWRIGTTLFWIIFIIVGEIVTFLSILVFMVRAKIFARRKSRLTSGTPTPIPARSGIHTRTKSSGSSLSCRPARYRNIVLRIALYPFAAAVTLSLVVVNDFRDAGHNHGVGVMGVLCSLRPLVYALLGATDPSLMRALKALYRSVLKLDRDQVDGGAVSPLATGFTESNLTRKSSRRRGASFASRLCRSRSHSRASGKGIIPMQVMPTPPPVAYTVAYPNPSLLSLESVASTLELGEVYREAERIRISVDVLIRSDVYEDEEFSKQI